jgi:hypothetical protein
LANQLSEHAEIEGVSGEAMSLRLGEQAVSSSTSTPFECSWTAVERREQQEGLAELYRPHRHRRWVHPDIMVKVAQSAHCVGKGTEAGIASVLGLSKDGVVKV